LTTPRRISPLFGIALSALLALCLIGRPTAAQAQDQPADIAPDSLADTATAIEVPPPPAPAVDVMVKDAPDDAGGAIVIDWEASPDESADTTALGVAGYVIDRSKSADGPWQEIGDATQGGTVYRDNKVVEDSAYFYRVGAYRIYLNAAGEKLKSTAYTAAAGPVKPKAQWFFMGRFWVLVWALAISMAIIFFIQRAKQGQELYVRKIAGIDAVDEAVGRATEMGKKIFYIPGIQDMNDVQTIAGIAILGRVAKLAAQYETWLEVPVSKSLVMVTARETMKESYSEVGRPDNFQDAQVHYLTDDQFGYAAAIDGMVVRERPATIFYMGAFFAESLILAETGNAAGAIQIAGTAMPSQLPFFVAACDYTLIGEELFAASAYLSREPRQLGSLKGQDFGKGLFLLFILIGVIWATVGLVDATGFDFSTIFSSQ